MMKACDKALEFQDIVQNVDHFEVAQVLGTWAIMSFQVGHLPIYLAFSICLFVRPCVPTYKTTYLRLLQAYYDFDLKYKVVSLNGQTPMISTNLNLISLGVI